MNKVPPSAAERMRVYRKRRRQGMQYVRIPLHVTEADALIRMGRLKDDSRTDAEVLQAAVLSLVYQALGESEIGRERLRSLILAASWIPSLLWRPRPWGLSSRRLPEPFPLPGLRRPSAVSNCSQQLEASS